MHFLIVKLLEEADCSFLSDFVLNFISFFLNGVILYLTSTLTRYRLFWIMENETKSANEKKMHVRKNYTDPS